MYFFYSPIKSSIICVYNLNSQLRKKISEEDLDYLSKKLTLPINDTNLSYVKDYIDDILVWYTNFNTAPLRKNLKKPEISLNCSHDEKIQCEIYQAILNHMWVKIDIYLYSICNLI